MQLKQVQLINIRFNKCSVERTSRATACFTLRLLDVTIIRESCRGMACKMKARIHSPALYSKANSFTLCLNVRGPG